MDGVCEKDTPADAARLTASEAACQAVFNTAELLEHIFSHLLPSQVIGAQRVCRQFRDIVATSPMLQQKVFSKVEENSGSEQKWALDGYSESSFTYKSALQQDDDHAKAISKVLSVASLNSALFKQAFYEPLFSKSECFSGRWTDGGEKVMLRDVGLKKYILEYTGGEAQSWADLHITNPSCRRARLFISLDFTSDFGVALWSNPVIVGNGVTLGKLMDALPDSVQFMCGRGNCDPTDLVYDHPERSIRQVISEYQKYYGSTGRIDCVSLTLEGAICPTASEREQFERGELFGRW